MLSMFGNPVKISIVAATGALSALNRKIVSRPSPPILTRAFQLACSNAANNTAAMRNPSIGSFSPNSLVLGQALELCRRELPSQRYHHFAECKSTCTKNFHDRYGSRAAENDSSEVGPFYPQLQKLIGRISNINGDFTTPTNSQFFMFKLL